jgi:hypothetical protein
MMNDKSFAHFIFLIVFGGIASGFLLFRFFSVKFVVRLRFIAYRRLPLTHTAADCANISRMNLSSVADER